MDRPDTGSIFATLAKGSDGRVSMASLVRGCLELCPVDGVSLSLMGAGQEGASAASDGLATVAQDLEFSLGEGPGTDAFALGGPVMVPDTAAADGRWPYYLRAAERVGVRAVYALPLHIGAAKLGLLGRIAPEGQEERVDGASSSGFVHDQFSSIRRATVSMRFRFEKPSSSWW